MRLRQVIESLVNAAASLPMVKRSQYGNVYDNWNAKSGSYGAVNVDIETLTQSGMMTTANLVLYYGDRLTPDGSNEVDLYEDGLNVLQSIINNVQISADEEGIMLSFDNYVATPFRQQFSDELAGVYARVIVRYQNDIGQCASV